MHLGPCKSAVIRHDAACIKRILTKSYIAVTGRSLQAGDLGKAVSIDVPSPDVVPSFLYTTSSNAPSSPQDSIAPAPVQGEASAPEAISLNDVGLATAAHTPQAAAGHIATDTSTAEPVAVDSMLPETSSAAHADAWTTAPICTATPNASNSVMDTTGRLWGWENQVSCAHKTASTPVYTASTAPGCGPTATNSGFRTEDSMGYSWGFEDGHSCVFRVSTASSLFYILRMPADANTSCTLFPALRLLPAEHLAIVMLQEPVQKNIRKLIGISKASLSVAGKRY